MSSASRSLSPTPPLSPQPDQAPDEPVDEDFQDPPVAPAANPGADIDNDLSDAESILSDVDEAQFEDFDPNQITIEERPAIAVDEDNVRLIGRHKRRKADGEVDGEAKKKKKEGRREKVKKSKKRKDSDDEFSGGEQMEGKRTRKKKAYIEGDEGARPRKERPKPRAPTPEDEEKLTPEERKYQPLLSCLIALREDSLTLGQIQDEGELLTERWIWLLKIRSNDAVEQGRWYVQPLQQPTLAIIATQRSW